MRFDELVSVAQAAEGLGHHVTVAEIADDYDVTVAIAEFAVEQVRG